MGGGRGIPICTDTCAIVGIGTEITNAKTIAPKSNFFILLPPLSIPDAFSSRAGVVGVVRIMVLAMAAPYHP